MVTRFGQHEHELSEYRKLKDAEWNFVMLQVKEILCRYAFKHDRPALYEIAKELK